MLFFCRNKIKNITKKDFLLLLTCVINCLIPLGFCLLNNYKIEFNEHIFTLSVMYNTFIFIIIASKFKTNKQEITTFLKRITVIGLVSVIINLILNFQNMLSLSAITNSYNVNFSSFFPNRNQYGLFMLIVVIANSFLVKNKQKNKYKILQIIFIANLILSMSRNSILGLVVFYFFKWRFENKKTERAKHLVSNKTLFVAFIIIPVLVSVVFLATQNQIISDMFSTLFVRTDTLESGSGRFDLWLDSVNIVNRMNPFFGIGRYLGLELNHQIHGSKLTHFHSMYIEKFVSHGIFGVLWLLTLIYIIWRKTKCSNNITKESIKAAIVAFLMVSIFETTTRFSIGYTDTFFMIFFFTLPQIIANSDFGKIKSSNKVKEVKCLN